MLPVNGTVNNKNILGTVSGYAIGGSFSFINL